MNHTKNVVVRLLFFANEEAAVLDACTLELRLGQLAVELAMEPDRQLRLRNPGLVAYWCDGSNRSHRISLLRVHHGAGLLRDDLGSACLACALLDGALLTFCRIANSDLFLEERLL